MSAKKFHVAPFVGDAWFKNHAQPVWGRRRYHCCLRCGYRWLGRNEFKGDSGTPKRCASCRSPLWNTGRINHPGQGRRSRSDP